MASSASLSAARERACTPNWTNSLAGYSLCESAPRSVILRANRPRRSLTETSAAPDIRTLRALLADVDLPSGEHLEELRRVREQVIDDPDTLMDLYEAQTAYAGAIKNADLIVMLCSMLHAIGTGNMTPAGVQLVCVDINPDVVTKLADRGSVESTGIVTDVGLFLNLLSRRLSED